MLQAMLAGVASIKAQQTRMNVIGNNLANVNTTAYKGTRVTFQDMLSQTIRGAGRSTDSIGGTNPLQYGLGVLIGSTDTFSEQGSLNATNRPSDLAIQGNGFFLTSNGLRTAYTRDGSFDLDANGDLVHRATGERVLGWDFVKQGAATTSTPIAETSSLNIPLGRMNAVQATSNVDMSGNLSGDATVGSTRAAPDWTTSARVYDSQGGPHDVTIQFFNRQDPPFTPPVAGAVSRWDWRVLDDAGVEIAQSDGGSPEGPQLYFDANGQPIDTGGTTSVTIAGGSPLQFNIGMDFSKITQLKTSQNGNAVSQVTVEAQDGFPPGSLQSFSINQDGIITGLFTNGLTRDLGQIAMAIFPNPGGMERTGNNLWRNSDNSGIPVVGQPRTGGRGVINSGFLEQSNVDIGSEFTDLIITQRGFQANTKVVTTVDEMLQDLISMKR
ncbi:MAG: flagellar hook protein FlgE [Armatimonadetes bacterium]|nr:flagellar hook protein FlgE [Armatimonadota bacterium]